MAGGGMKGWVLEITDDAALAIERYTARKLDCYRRGTMTGPDWEDCRGYAVDAIMAILLANSEAFRFSNDYRAIKAKQEGRAA